MAVFAFLGNAGASGPTAKLKIGRKRANYQRNARNTPKQIGITP
jgi:hypothetical protein